MFEDWKARIWSRRLQKKAGQAVSVGFIKTDDRKKAAFDAWAEQCAQRMQPNAHSIGELEAWLAQHYRTEPLGLSEGRLKMLTAESVRNFFPEMLKTQVTPPRDGSYREFERHHLELERAQQEAMQIDPASLGLDFFGYRVLLGDGINTEVVFERKTGQVCMQCSWPGTGANPEAERFSLAFTKQYGVTQADIDGKTPRFLGYITALRDAGEPGFEMGAGNTK